jgi:thiamine kinase-like enzyme
MTVKGLLSNLPCFTQIVSISKITSGLSQQCFKVTADNKIYFAKTISDSTEVSVAVSAGKSGLSPRVIYHDYHWLITNFIDADNLELKTIATKDKINQAIKLMVQCHQLKVKPVELSAKDIIKSLLNTPYYLTLQKTALLALADSILAPLNESKNSVCCHGDLNFSNILINIEKSTWLVDYECACVAPIEYDLAMFIAVNSLASDEITLVIEQYELQSSVNVDPKLLNHYLLFCYFINALWYFNQYKKTNNTNDINKDNHQETLIELSLQQWRKFDAVALYHMTSQPLLDLISSNIKPPKKK